MTSSSSWSFSSDAAGRMRVGVCTRSPKKQRRSLRSGVYASVWEDLGRAGDARVIIPTRFAAQAAFGGTVLLAGWVTVWPAGLDSPGIEHFHAAATEERDSPR